MIRNAEILDLLVYTGKGDVLLCDYLLLNGGETFDLELHEDGKLHRVEVKEVIDLNLLLQALNPCCAKALLVLAKPFQLGQRALA